MANVLNAVRYQFARTAGPRRSFELAVALILATLAVTACVAGRVAVSPAGAEIFRAAATTPPQTAASVIPTPAEAQQAAVARLEIAEVAAVVDTTSRKYRVASNAMREFVNVAYVEARRNRIDPLLVVAVIAVESRFNPIAQSDFGATGLMQIIPHYHADKFSASTGETVLDPHINIRVGTRALKEYVSRGGTETAGLQLYNGSSWDRHHTYATKVLAERARLREVARQGRARLNLRVA